MPRLLNNVMKIRRIEFDIKELTEKLEFCQEDKRGTGATKKAIEVRLKAMDFLEKAERNFTWRELMQEFHFADTWKSYNGGRAKGKLV